MSADHVAGDGISGCVCVITAVDGLVFFDKWAKPCWVGSGSCGGDTAGCGMKQKAADGIDG